MWNLSMILAFVIQVTYTTWISFSWLHSRHFKLLRFRHWAFSLKKDKLSTTSSIRAALITADLNHCSKTYSTVSTMKSVYHRKTVSLAAEKNSRIINWHTTSQNNKVCNVWCFQRKMWRTWRSMIPYSSIVQANRRTLHFGEVSCRQADIVWWHLHDSCFC